MKRKILTAIIPFLIGCSTTPNNLENEVVRNFPKEHVSGVEYKNINETKTPYKLEEQVLFGQRYYFQKTKNSSINLPFEILPYQNTERLIDLDSGEIELISDKKYIPTKVEGNKQGAEDKWIDGVLLMNKGKYRIGAEMSSIEELKKRTGIDDKNFGYKIITTDEDAQFIIQTINISGEEYFFPLVEQSQRNQKGKLDFYFIPTKNSQIKITNKCGNITIYNKNNIYRPIDPQIFPEFFTQKTEEPQGIETQRVLIDLATPEPLNLDELENVPTPIPAPTPTNTPALY